MNLFTDRLDSPIGELRVAVDLQGRLVRLDLSPLPTLDAVPDGARCAHVLAQLRQYFGGTRQQFELELLPVGTPFQQRAWRALRQIPFGSTCSYGEQAAMLGDANKARAVGAANGRNPIALVIPCHRVVGSDGNLCGYAGGLLRKRWLLAHERAAAAQGDAAAAR